MKKYLFLSILFFSGCTAYLQPPVAIIQPAPVAVVTPVPVVVVHGGYYGRHW